MESNATVTFSNGEKKVYKKGTNFITISRDITNPNGLEYLGVKVNNRVTELFDVLKDDCTLEFLDLASADGNKFYIRGLKLLLYRATRDLYGKCILNIVHSVHKGIYCTIDGVKITDAELKKIEKKMTEIVSKDEPIEKELFSKEDAIKIFEAEGLLKKVKLLKYRNSSDINLYKLGWVYDYFFGFMVPSTGYLKKFKLLKSERGFLLKHPTTYMMHSIPEDIRQDKLFETFNDTQEWVKVLGIQTVGDLNDKISEGKINEIIMVAEALQEKRIGLIADEIANDPKVMMALISGPSSSGKTTFANRLSVQLKANGKKPIIISLDNYYLERSNPNMPVDEFGKLDLEALEALDVEKFNEDMKSLLDGKEIKLPIFNFATGKREFSDTPLKLEDNSMLIIEGIHGLNEKLSSKIPKSKKFKIYVSALTPLNLDEHNRISTSDNRLLRRIVRDSKFRAYPAIRTLDIWESVRRGEEKNIFPYQEEADVMFNTALVYELPILKHYAEPMLYGVPQDSPHYAEAKRLIKFLNYILGTDSEMVPPNSLLREFIGGSSFY